MALDGVATVKVIRNARGDCAVTKAGFLRLTRDFPEIFRPRERHFPQVCAACRYFAGACSAKTVECSRAGAGAAARAGAATSS